MSYCRRSPESDVYVYPASEGIVCYACRLRDEIGNFVATHRTQAIAHLHEHEARGHKVPPKAFSRLAAELAAEGDAVEIDRDV